MNSPLGTSDHSVVSIRVDARCKESPDAPFHRTIFRYDQAEWDNFRSFIADAPLSVFFNKGASEAASYISEWILDGMDIFIPSKKYQQRPNSQPWYTPECAAAIAHRNHFFHVFRQNRSSENEAAFKAARNCCRAVLKGARSSYAQSIQTRIGNERLGSREFWRITNNIFNRGKATIPSLINGPEVISTSSGKAKIFASNFAANSTLDDQGHTLPDFPTLTDSSIDSFTIKAKDIAKSIQNLDSSKATGPDGIPVVVLKKLCPEISPILAKLFNKCLKEECFPMSWKLSHVCPVFKNSGESSSPSQYRPISLLSVISKLFEAAINTAVLGHLAKNNLLSDQQYGFRPRRSTADILTVISHRISEALDRGFDTRVIALDISKAFDKVWHKGLLHKISSYGISGKVFAIIRSFLSDRSLRVVINGQSSDAYSINAGVPQGSLLGPTLFLLYINDLPKWIIRSMVDIYADDTTDYGCTSADVDHRVLRLIRAGPGFAGPRANSLRGASFTAPSLLLPVTVLLKNTYTILTTIR